MKNYYAEKLNAVSMVQVYETNIPRIRQYLSAEIEYIIQNLNSSDSVLEFGAGFGRILKELAPHAAAVAGFDISQESVALGQQYLKGLSNVKLVQADIHQFETDQRYDVVLCVQNGLSAMKGDPAHTVEKAVSLVKTGGKALFSSYSPKFWAYRLAWFQEQADKGLLGQLDFEKSIHGEIVCQDGFTATTHTEEDFLHFASALPYPYEIQEVDRSSVFLVIHKNDTKRI